MHFAPPAMEVERRADGSIDLRSRTSLAPYPATITEPLRRWARERPDTIFLRERDGATWRTIAYGAIAADVRRVAAGLLARGLDRSTPIAILSGASIDHAIVALAALDVGIPVAPISPAYATALADFRRLHLVLSILEPYLVVALGGAEFEPALASLDAALPVLRAGDLRAFGQGLDQRAVDTAHAAVRADDLAKILFTSGSTSEPKGVINTHRMLCSNQQSLAQAWPFLAAHDLVLTDWLPWHHTFGGNHNFNMALFHGGELVIDDGRPVPGAFARSIENLRDHPPTVYFNVPRGHRLIAETLAADDALARRFFSRLRLIGNAAAALPAPTWTALRDLAERYGTGVAVASAWGLTETAPMATTVQYALEHAADVGLPGPGTELRFVPAGGKLEVRVRGPNVTPGYYRRDDLTRAAFDDDAFFRTGDAMRFAVSDTPERGLFFDGRLAENFKLTSGTWVDAGAVRLAVLAATAGLVDEVVVAGEGADEIGVLLFTAPHVDQRRIAAALRAYNATAGGTSFSVGRAVCATEPLSPEDGEITDKGSVNQRRVLERRPALVEQLFCEPPAEDVIVPG